VRLAVQKGYRILEIYEFMNTTLQDTTPKLGKVVCLLAILTLFFKLKAEASSYPALVRTPADEE
jgi:hypothetical protein